MQISVTGPHGGQLNPELVQFTRSAVKDFAQQLGISRLHTTIEIQIHNKSVINGNTFAEVECLNKRHFIIDLCLFSNWLANLAHEMVHVKQFALEELDSNLTRWKSNKYCENIEYWDQPWEKEARKMEMKLLENFHKKH